MSLLAPAVPFSPWWRYRKRANTPCVSKKLSTMKKQIDNGVTDRQIVVVTMQLKILSHFYGTSSTLKTLSTRNKIKSLITKILTQPDSRRIIKRMVIVLPGHCVGLGGRAIDCCCCYCCCCCCCYCRRSRRWGEEEQEEEDKRRWMSMVTNRIWWWSTTVIVVRGQWWRSSRTKITLNEHALSIRLFR